MTKYVCVLFLTSVAVAQVPKTHTLQVNGHTFTLPEGFTIELAAKTPLVDRPIVAAFDDVGRLYVADSSGSNDKVAEQVKNPTHRIMRLEDTDGDGVFDKSVVFADKMMFPEGILWHRGNVYVAAPPHIWKLTDTNNDGVADKRDVWFDGKTLTGCANDLHGPYLGPDGWLYWCKGAFAKQTYKLPNGKEFTTRASHIFRAKPDGTNIEPVMTGGMDNPVDVAFLPHGERFFTTTFLQHPAGGKRDGIIHALEGAIYGKDHDVIYDTVHRWTSPHLMPPMTHLGPAAPAGLHCYASATWGKEYTHNLFACQFNLRKVSRHVLVPDGSTYATKDSDFVVSDQQDFHPTDVLEDADGSLLIVDTGGWYKLCCPSSQLVKVDVYGAIYRVRKKDAQKLPDPRGKDVKIDQANLNGLLSLLAADARPAVRQRGAERLVMLAKDDATVRTLVLAAATVPNAEQQVTFYQLLMQVDHPAAMKALYDNKWLASADDKDTAWEAVALTRLHGIGLHRDRDAAPTLRGLLATDSGFRRSPLVRRAIVTTLGRLEDKEAVPLLLKALELPQDHALEHATTYALIQIGDVKATEAGLKSASPTVQRCVLTALDQMGATLDAKTLLPHLSAKDVGLKETALWIVARHPEFAPEVAVFLQKRLLVATFTPKDTDEVAPLLARFATVPALHDVLSETVREAKTLTAKRAVLQAFTKAGVKELPPEWRQLFGRLLEQAPKDLLPDILSTLRQLPPPKTDVAPFRLLLLTLTDNDQPDEVRLGAMAVMPNGLGGFGLGGVSKSDLALLLQAIDKEQPVALRGLAADVLAKAKLSPSQLQELIATLPKAGPLEVDRVLGAFTQSTDDAVGKQLVQTLNTPALRPVVRVDSVKERLKKYGPQVHAEAEKLYAALNAELAQQTTRLEETLKTLPKGDIRRGQAVFNSQKTSCIACHTIGYVGGKIGPDLTRIGGIRTERDLLEAVLFPSASFVRSYEPLTVRTLGGVTHNGVPKKDAPDEIILTLAADKEVRIPRKDIEDIQPGKVSIMPAGLDKELSPQELADLLAFLKACR